MEKNESRLADVAVAGHFAIDTILLPNLAQSIVVLGGSVTYVSLVARRLGATASIVSRVGGDFPESYMRWLQQEGIDLSGVFVAETEQTTRFELEYCSNFSDRLLKLKVKASALSQTDIPSCLHAKAIHLAPIAGEIPFEIVDLLRSRADVLSLDAQGMLRRVDAIGNISLVSLADMQILELVDVCKCSLEEINILTGKYDVNSSIKAIHDCGVGTVIVTMGAKGALLSIGDIVYEIPTYTPKAVVDPTGAGDVFVGGFLTELVRGRDSFWCACVGSAAASIVVEGFGPAFPGDKEEVYRRATNLYET